MQPMTELEREFLAYAVEQAHPFVRACAGADLPANLLKTVRTDIERIDSAEFARWHGGGREQFGVPISAFNNRLMELGSFRLIAGIRFRDRDIRFPFVGVEQCSVPLGTVADSAAVLHDLHAAFAPFRPRAVSFFHPAHLPLRIRQVRGDYHVLAAPARSMIEHAPPLHLDRVVLVTSPDLDFHDQYAALYDDIFAERHWARAELNIETRETLQDCLVQELLFQILVDGAWSGIVAGTHATRGGIAGIEVVEIVLSRGARGSGLGVAVQRRFAEQVAQREPMAVIWGTVADANVPMRRTAERAGRIDVGTAYWIEA
jgi:hypothetical protein